MEAVQFTGTLEELHKRADRGSDRSTVSRGTCASGASHTTGAREGAHERADCGRARSPTSGGSSVELVNLTPRDECNNGPPSFA